MLTRLQIIHNRHRHWLRAFIRFLTYLLAFFLSAIAYWIADNFGEPSLEQGGTTPSHPEQDSETP